MISRSSDHGRARIPRRLLPLAALLSLAPESWIYLTLLTSPISGGIGLVFGFVEAVRRRKARGDEQ